ncbi:MAG: SpoIID/LytB domain-containing protein, partial [Bacilli bacterium]
MKFTKDFFTKANRKVLIAVIGTIGSIILVPIIILLFFTGVTVSFFDIFSMDKMAFTSMVSDPNNTCRNPQGVIMAAEWLYTVGGTQPNGSRPQNHIEYARSFRKTNSRGREIVGYHGKSFVYGWDSRWNQIISPYYNRGEKIWQDQREGLDCSGFVSWAFWNAGFKEVKPATSADGTVTKWGILRDPVTSVEPGDYAHRSGHIGIVVEVNEEGVYVIESQGHRQDLRKNFYSFEKIKNRKSGFTDFYYSNLYDTGDSSCNWNIPSIYVNSSNIFVDVKNTRITLEEYIMGTLKNELNWGENINAEALKAQAVAARTYVLYHAIKNDFPRKVTLKMEKNNNSKA